MYMLDTCAFIWYILDDEKLPQDVKEIIAASETIYISYTTLWEITTKQTIGKLDAVTMNVYELAELCMNNGIIVLPLKLSYLARLRNLPLIHRDPFDRIIIATALEEGCTLLTCDSEIIKYPDAKTLWHTTKEDK